MAKSKRPLAEIERNKKMNEYYKSSHENEKIHSITNERSYKKMLE
jgi:hypothetical protein